MKFWRIKKRSLIAYNPVFKKENIKRMGMDPASWPLEISIKGIFLYLWIMNDLIQNNLGAIIAACKKHHVEIISLFGSAAKNAMHEESDIDLLVEFSNDIDVLDYADNYFSLLDQLQEILNRKVDLVSSKSLKNPILKEEVYQSKVDLYAA